MEPDTTDKDKVFTGMVIRSIECKDLPTSWLEQNDPYIVLTLHGNYNYHTDVQFRQEKPHWENLNFVLIFPKGHNNEPLNVSVMDREKVEFKDKQLANVMIPVWEVQTAPATDERANPKVFVLERGLEPQGNIKITFVPLMHGDHPSPGSLPIVGVQWTNWGRNLHAMPKAVFCPRTKEDMVEIVKRAVAEKRKIRVSGSGHSWSPVTPTEDFLIDCRQMRKVITIDQMAGTALFECGCSVSDLDPPLTTNGLCLPTNVVLTSVRYGGVIATGCHGPGVDNPTISDYVSEMTIIGYDGKDVNVKTYTEADGDLMSAIKVNLGCFGVIYSIKLKLPKLRNLAMEDTVVPLEKAMSAAYLRQLHEENEYVEMFWWPFTKEVWVKTWNTVDEPALQNQLRDTINDAAQSLSSEFGVFLLDVVERIPKKTPMFCNAIWTLAKRTVIKGGKRVLTMPQALHYQHYIDTVRCLDTEYAIDVDDEYNNVHDAWNIIIDTMNAYAKKDQYPINITVEFRVHARSTAMLSPSYNDDASSHHCYIEFLSYFRTPQWEDCSRDIGMAWMKHPKLHARPHWAKMYQTVALKNMVPHLKKEFGKNWDRWVELRTQTDPTHMFMNTYMETMFYGPLDPPDPDVESTPIKHEELLSHHLGLAEAGLNEALEERKKNMKAVTVVAPEENEGKKEEIDEAKKEKKEKKHKKHRAETTSEGKRKKEIRHSHKEEGTHKEKKEHKHKRHSLDETKKEPEPTAAPADTKKDGTKKEKCVVS